MTAPEERAREIARRYYPNTKSQHHIAWRDDIAAALIAAREQGRAEMREEAAKVVDPKSIAFYFTT